MARHSLTELEEKYEQVRLNFKFHSFLLAALVLICIGVSQIIYGWAGDSFAARYLYPTFCFLMGGGIIWVWVWVVKDAGLVPIPTQTEFERQLKEEEDQRAFQTLGRLATGHYGEFELTDELFEDLETLIQRGYVRQKRDLQEKRERGLELSEYFVVPDAVKEYFQKPNEPISERHE